MTKQTRAMMPAELASGLNLMAHPMAASAAMSAIGAGMAGHAMGVWIGTMSGAAAASQRAFLRFADTGAPDVEAFRDALRTPAMRATEAATAVIAEVEIGTATKAPATVRKLTPKAKAVRPEAKAADVKGAGEPVAETPAVAASHVEASVQLANPVADVEAAPEVTADVVEAAAALAVEPPMPAAESVAPVEIAAEVSEADIAPAVAELKAPIAVEAVEVVPRQPAAIDRPEQPDDLKAISGIGPKLEQVLNGMGIWTYAQVAGLDGAETAWLDDALGFRGRIGRDDWIGQAAKLTSVKG